MSNIYSFLTQQYVHGLSNYVIVMAPIVLLLAVLTLTKGGLIRHFINHGK
jgi:hypothetical protein